jgi:4,5-DOPA dioxygenase extradiol
MYPAAELPVVAVSLPVPRDPADLVAIGRALTPLRDEGILVAGSGGIVRNLRRIDPRPTGAPVPAWAQAFDTRVRERLEAGDAAALLDYARRELHAALAVPTTEHFDPLFVALGAAGDDRRVQDVYTGFRHGSLSLRTFALSG